MWWLVVGAAIAHGPAPAILDVLAWESGSACPGLTDAPVPAVLRTNIGVHRRSADGTYAFGCPSRWGDSELALAAAAGTRLFVAGAGGVFVSDDRGCTARALAVPQDDTVVAVRADADGGWLVTRDFGAGTGALWRLGDAAEEVARWSDFLPDGLVVDPDGVVWLSAALPQPSLRVWDPVAGEGERTPAWPASSTLDRLTPRTPEAGGVWLVAGAGPARTLWWTDGVDVRVGPGPAEALIGPVEVDGGWIAALDGRVFVEGPDATWADSGVDVDWTCLNGAPGGAVACALREARFVSAWTAAGPVSAVVASLDQLGPPEVACQDLEGACDLDWLHFGAEAGLVQTAPGLCPDQPRTPISEVPDAEPPETPAASCGCAASAPGGGPAGLRWLVVLAVLGRRARGRRPG